ncbi:MAG: branched-chain amino acid ABC transporter substrate-binding protein [SAR324 cluster bacterium]|nr:branched-chain amino acid ABC transporter substrate-binding protein [SAR324 cluster bacterium]
MMKLRSLLFLLVGAFVLSVFSTSAFAAGTVKIAYIDPLSGGFGDVGDAGHKHFKFMADKIRAEGGFLGGTNFEIVPFDNKISAKESLVQLKHAIDQGIRFITQGNGSSVAGALIEAVKKHNRRNPDKTVLYFNYAAVTPAFTEAKCDFWHFRFDAHVDMKIAAITDAIKGEPGIKKVYLLNQDYVFGHAVSAAAQKMLKAKRPDIEIVGNTFHPILKVKDFSPYIAKIKKTGAQAVITGNWGADMSLLGKGVNESGLKASFYTFYAGGLGTPSTMGAAMDGLRQVTEWHDNLSVEENRPFDAKFRKAYNDKFSDGGKAPWYYGRVRTMMEMLVKAFNKAGSTDPKAVAYALEGMEHTTYYGKVVMGANDHQLLQPLYISRFTKTDGKMVKYDRENTGYGPTTEAKTQSLDTATSAPDACKMKRP